MKLTPLSESWIPPILTTERLILRAITLEDAPSIFEYTKNPNVSRYTLWQPYQVMQDTENFIQEYVFSLYKDRVPEPLGITLKSSSHKVIGTVGCFWVSKENQTMELAYALSESYWKQGLVPEAALAIVDYCFQKYPVQRIQARCRAEHKASSRVMEKIGMKFEGTLRSALFCKGSFWDMHHYSILKQEWSSI